MFSCKDKETVLSKAYKFKGTPFSVSEDFMPSVRIAWRKLLEFAKPQGLPFKLGFDKLLIRNK